MTAFSRRSRGKPRHPQPALQDVSVRIPSGAITGLVGPDGAGKTTFLRLAAGLPVPTRGRITVLGADTRHDLAFRDNLAYMPQKFGLYEDLTVLENLLLYARLRGIPRAEMRASIDRLLAFTAWHRSKGGRRNSRPECETASS